MSEGRRLIEHMEHGSLHEKKGPRRGSWQWTAWGGNRMGVMTEAVGVEKLGAGAPGMRPQD
jgi:hypothetical protein